MAKHLDCKHTSLYFEFPVIYSQSLSEEVFVLVGMLSYKLFITDSECVRESIGKLNVKCVKSLTINK